MASALAAALPDPAGARVGAAVSGGGDSMAMLVLLADWAAKSDVVVEVASVDHGLRPDAADEAAQVAHVARELGLRHETLQWTGWDGKGNLQAAARRARQDLLGTWASARGLSHLCLGHTRDDQAETVLMRLARGSGVDGLAAMAPARRDAEGLVWLRPLLDVSRADLRELLRRRGLDWSEDPSNDDPRFDRVRVRRLLEELAPLGLSAAALAETAGRMRAARRVLGKAAADAAEALVEVEAGEILLGRGGYFALPDDTGWRLFADALCQVAAERYRPRFDALRRTIAGLRAGGRATLHGCLCQAHGTVLRIGREPAAAAGPTPAPGIWDRRWRISCPKGRGLRTAALGERGLEQRPDWREAGLPRESLLASPALWDGARLHAALLLDDSPDCRAEPVWSKADFIAFVQSD